MQTMLDRLWEKLRERWEPNPDTTARAWLDAISSGDLTDDEAWEMFLREKEK